MQENARNFYNLFSFFMKRYGVCNFFSGNCTLSTFTVSEFAISSISFPFDEDLTAFIVRNCKTFCTFLAEIQIKYVFSYGNSNHSNPYTTRLAL